MSRYFLRRLQIEGFRGINNLGSPLDLEFEPNSVNSIWAPNGLGKSSIFEALCYAIRGYVPKLKDLEATERPGDYYCNRFHGGDATIVLTFAADDGSPDVVIEVVRSSGGARSVTSPSGHSDPDQFLQSLDEDHTLLDYATFESFIESSALERGRSFSSLLGMAHLSKVRQALERLSNRRNLNTDFGVPELEAELTYRTAEHTAATSLIREQYQFLLGSSISEPIDIDAVIEEATAALAGIELLAKDVGEQSLMDISFEALSEKVKSEEGGEKREKLAEIIRDLKKLESLAPSADEQEEREKLAGYVDERDQALEGTRGDLFRRMYSAVQSVLESGDWPTPEVCPACESTPLTVPSEFVSAKLSAYELAEEKNTEILGAWTAATCTTRLRDLESCDPMEVPEDQRTFGDWDALARSMSVSAKMVGGFCRRLDTLDADRLERIEALKAEKLELEKVLPQSLVTLTEQLVTAEKLRDGIRDYEAGVDEDGPLAKVKRRLAQRTRWREFIGGASAEFAAAESAFSRDRTAALETRYQEMYKGIMFSEEIVPALEKATGSERLDLRLGQFHDLEGLSARALLSESYRNAFGISVFLSAALGKNSAARFIVLDDITSSFDGGHQFNLMELLRTEVGRPNNPNGVQIIILSHDGLLEKLFNENSNRDDWSHRRLQGQAPRGAVLCDTQGNNLLRADAEHFLSAGQVRQAEHLIRQYLEFKLLQVITKVRIPVPIDFAIRDDRRMVKNCLDCIEAQVDLHDQVGDLVLDPPQLRALKSTHIPALVGNWVSHYSTGVGASFTPAALRGVLQAIDDLSDCFRYHDAGSGNLRFYKALDRRS